MLASCYLLERIKKKHYFFNSLLLLLSGFASHLHGRVICAMSMLFSTFMVCTDAELTKGTF